MTAAAAIAGTVVLRPARPADCERVWEWNFAPEVRAVSSDPRHVPYDEHARWYARKLADLAGRIWIVEDGGVAAGVVRLDLPRALRAGGSSGARIDPGAPRPVHRSALPDDATARISIALGARSRGRGVGRRAIEAACAAWAGPVIAEIRADHAASRACFTACNFELVSEADGLATYHWSP